MFTQNSLGHGFWESLIPYWLRVLQVPALGLHEDKFGIQPITFEVDENIYMESHMASMDNGGWGL